MARVAGLLDEWAVQSGLDDEERVRWRAAGYLHDALRDAPLDVLRALVPETERMPDAVLHGPAAAERLRRDGVDDEELLAAIAFHTIGDPAFGRLGRALYAADFLESGRTFMADRRAELRARAQDELDAVVFEVARMRIRHLVDRGMPINPRTASFWNRMVEDVG